MDNGWGYGATNLLRPESIQQAARAATDAEWCRRVFLDLLGRVPTVSELDAFRSDKSRSKRRAWVDRLLGSE